MSNEKLLHTSLFHCDMWLKSEASSCTTSKHQAPPLHLPDLLTEAVLGVLEQIKHQNHSAFVKSLQPNWLNEINLINSIPKHFYTAPPLCFKDVFSVCGDDRSLFQVQTFKGKWIHSHIPFSLCQIKSSKSISKPPPSILFQGHLIENQLSSTLRNPGPSMRPPQTSANKHTDFA